MTTPTRVTPAELTTLADRLGAAGKALEDSLDLFDDPVMWSSADLYQEYFGPAREIAAKYAAMAKKVPDYVHAASGRLNQGADVFRTASSGFAARDTQHGSKIKGHK